MLCVFFLCNLSKCMFSVHVLCNLALSMLVDVSMLADVSLLDDSVCVPFYLKFASQNAPPPTSST